MRASAYRAPIMGTGLGGHGRRSRSAAARGRADIQVNEGGWTGQSALDQATYDTASITAPAGTWLVIGVTNTGAASQDPTSVAAVAGNLSLSLIGAAFTVTATNNTRMSVWAVYCAASFSGVIRITFPGTATACAWAPLVLTGASQSSTVVQISAGAVATGTAVAANALAAFEHAGNLCVCFIATRDAGAITAGTGFTVHGQASAGSPVLKIGSESAKNDNTADATIAVSAAWGAIALEVRAAA